MNKRQILASLNKIANELDKTGLIKEANSITNIMTRLADETKVKRELELLSSPWEHHKEKSYNPENRDEDDTYFFTDHATVDKYYQNPLGGTNFLTQDHYVNLKKMNELFGMFWKAIPWSLSKKLDELAKYRESRSLKELFARVRDFDQRIDDTAEYVSPEEFTDLIKLAERSFSFLRMYRILSPSEIDLKITIIKAIKQQLMSMMKEST